MPAAGGGVREQHRPQLTVLQEEAFNSSQILQCARHICMLLEAGNLRAHLLLWLAVLAALPDVLPQLLSRGFLCFNYLKRRKECCDEAQPGWNQRAVLAVKCSFKVANRCVIALSQTCDFRLWVNMEQGDARQTRL